MLLLFGRIALVRGVAGYSLSVGAYARTCVRTYTSVYPVHCGKTADRIPIPFSIIGRTGAGMTQVVGFGDRSTGRGTFWGESAAHHCNRWGLYGVRVCQCLNRRSCGLGWCVRWADVLLYYMRVHFIPGEGDVLGLLFPIFTVRERAMLARY